MITDTANKVLVTTGKLYKACPGVKPYIYYCYKLKEGSYLSHKLSWWDINKNKPNIFLALKKETIFWNSLLSKNTVYKYFLVNNETVLINELDFSLLKQIN